MTNHMSPIWEMPNSKYSDCWRLVGRHNFVSNIDKENKIWKRNSPIPINSNQTTSQPTLITNMLEYLFQNYNLSEHRHIRVLDIGSGSGIVTALLACIIGKDIHNKNEVIGIDIYDNLIKDSRNNIHKMQKNAKEEDKIKFKKFAKMEFKKINIYDLFKDPNLLGKFNLIYVGAEAKSPEEIHDFKNGIKKLLKINGVAIAPIRKQLQLFKNTKGNTKWKKLPMATRFVALTRPNMIGGENSLEKKQKEIIKEREKYRWNINCDKSTKICKNITISGRSAKLYKNHLFPDFSSMKKVEKWAKNKCIIDVASGLNTMSSESFISRLAKKKIGIDVVGTDIKNLNKTKKNKHLARYIRGNAKTMKLKQLKLNKNCKNRVILINNFLYLWIDNPNELKKIYKNLFSWLKPGSEIRIFPVYFGRYDMYNKDLKNYLESKCDIKIYDPKITSDNYYQWDNTLKKKVYIKKKYNAFEKAFNKKLDVKTLVLTLK